MTPEEIRSHIVDAARRHFYQGHSMGAGNMSPNLLEAYTAGVRLFNAGFARDVCEGLYPENETLAEEAREGWADAFEFRRTGELPDRWGLGASR